MENFILDYQKRYEAEQQRLEKEEKLKAQALAEKKQTVLSRYR